MDATRVFFQPLSEKLFWMMNKIFCCECIRREIIVKTKGYDGTDEEEDGDEEVMEISM